MVFGRIIERDRNVVNVYILGKGRKYKEVELGWDLFQDREKVQLERRTRQQSHPGSQGYD